MVKEKMKNFWQNGRFSASDNLERQEKYFDIAMQNCALQTND